MPLGLVSSGVGIGAARRNKADTLSHKLSKRWCAPHKNGVTSGAKGQRQASESRFNCESRRRVGVNRKIDRDRRNNLYKLWNRMSSGSYMPPPVRAVSIPKKSGGERTLGIPTVTDRIAQMVVKLQFEPEVEPHFLPDSYGYRPGKSAIQAVESLESGAGAIHGCWSLISVVYSTTSRMNSC